jgi:flagellar biosynthetic protein FlhB
VLAKGSDKVALRIREIAIENKIAIFEEPPLARALYYTAEVNDEVPSGLYVAVAQVLAYVYQLRNSSRYRGRRPARPNPEIPEEFMQYTQGSNEEE